MLSEVTVEFPNQIVWHIAPEQMSTSTLEEVFNAAGEQRIGAKRELARDAFGSLMYGEQPSVSFDTPIGQVVFRRHVPLVQVEGAWQQPTWVDRMGFRPLVSALRRLLADEQS